MSNPKTDLGNFYKFLVMDDDDEVFDREEGLDSALDAAKDIAENETDESDGPDSTDSYTVGVYKLVKLVTYTRVRKEDTDVVTVQ